MINDKEYLEELNFAELMSIKRSARDRQVDAVYAAAPQILEASSARAKAVLRGKSASIARPQRFSALNDRQIDRPYARALRVAANVEQNQVQFGTRCTSN